MIFISRFCGLHCGVVAGDLDMLVCWRVGLFPFDEVLGFLARIGSMLLEWHESVKV